MPRPSTGRTATPLWVKLSAAVGLVLILLVGIHLLTGNGPWHHAMPPGMAMPMDKPAP